MIDVTNSVEAGAPSEGVPKAKRVYPPRMKSGEFIKLWNSSKSVKEAVEKTGMSYAGATFRAKRMAAKGVALKKLMINTDTCPAT